MARQAAAIGSILERECGPAVSTTVLDCACGIGTQALGLAKRPTMRFYGMSSRTFLIGRDSSISAGYFRRRVDFTNQLLLRRQVSEYAKPKGFSARQGSSFLLNELEALRSQQTLKLIRIDKRKMLAEGL